MLYQICNTLDTSDNSSYSHARLLILDVIIFRWSLNFNLYSGITPFCFWDEDCVSWMLLKNNSKYFLRLFTEGEFWVCWLGSSLELIFHLKSQSLFLAKKLFNYSIHLEMFLYHVWQRIKNGSLLDYLWTQGNSCRNICPIGTVSIQYNPLLPVVLKVRQKFWQICSKTIVF